MSELLDSLCGVARLRDCATNDQIMRGEFPSAEEKARANDDRALKLQQEADMRREWRAS